MIDLDRKKEAFLCLTLQQKIQQIALAIKGTIDSLHEDQVNDTWFGMRESPCTPSNYAENKSHSFVKKLLMSSFLCFPAIRPVQNTKLSKRERVYTKNGINFGPHQGDYLNNQSSLVKSSAQYKWSYVCMVGNIVELYDYQDAIDLGVVEVGLLTDTLMPMTWVFRAFIIAFLPLIILRFLPWSDDVAIPDYQRAINLLSDKAKYVMCSENADEDQPTEIELETIHSPQNELIRNHVAFCLMTENKNKGVMTMSKAGPQKTFDWSRKALIRELSSVSFEENFDEVRMDSKWETEEINDNGTEAEQNLTLEDIERKCSYLPIDSKVPSIFGVRNLVFGEVKSKHKIIALTFTMLRTFIYIMLLSCGAIALMILLDYVFLYDTIQRIIKFSAKYGIIERHLWIWNFIPLWEVTFEEGSLQFYQDFSTFLAAIWVFSVFIYSIPALTRRCIKFVYPSEYVGFFRVVPFQKKHLFGLDRVRAGLTQRLGILFSKQVWFELKRQAFDPNPKTGKRSFLSILKGIISMLGFLSFFPIIAIIPSLYSWDKKFRPRNVFRAIIFFVSLSVSGLIMCHLCYDSIDIYMKFLFFTAAGVVGRQSQTLAYIGVIGGLIGFILSIRSQINDAILTDKLFIYGILREHHEQIISEEDIRKKREKVIFYNRENPFQQVFVPELVLTGRCSPYPCIPKELYDKIVAIIRPKGRQRVEIMFKIVALGVFFAFIFTLITGVGLSGGKMVGSMDMIITVAATVVPTLLAKLQSAQTLDIVSLKKREIVLSLVRKFLETNPNYYNFSPDLLTAFAKSPT